MDGVLYSVPRNIDVKLLLYRGARPKTPPEDFQADLNIFGMIMDALKHEKRQTEQEVH